MIRLTAPLGRYILSALRFLAFSGEAKKFHSSSPNQLGREWANDKKITTAQFESLWDRETGNFPPQIGLDVAIERLEEYLRSRAGVTDMIESLAEVLKGTLGRSIISGETLKLLQNAVLRGDEFIELNKNLKSQSLHCTQCAHPFESQSMEAACVYRDTTGTKLLCSTCAYPRVVACSTAGCKSVAPVSREFQNNWLTAQAAPESNCGGKHRPVKEKPMLEEENGRHNRRPALDVLVEIPPNVPDVRNPFRNVVRPRGGAAPDLRHANVARWADMLNEAQRGIRNPAPPGPVEWGVMEVPADAGDPLPLLNDEDQF